MFHIVSFPATEEREEEVEIIHDLWILPDRGRCYFPSFWRKQIKKALKTAMKPDPESWKVYNMRILHTFDSYETACERLPLAEITSNLDTSDNEDIQRRKEKRRKNKRKVPEEIEDSLDKHYEMSKHYESLPLPPSVPCHSFAAPTDFSGVASDLSELSFMVEHREQETLPQFLPVKALSKTNEVLTPRPQQVQVTPFQKKVLKWMAEMDKKMEESNMMTTRILLHLQGNNSSNAAIIEEELPKLPVKTQEEFKALETFIESASNFNKLAKYLSKKGGNGVADTTKRILKTILHYGVAMQFNWAGRGDKEAFKDSKIKMLVISAVRESNPSYDEKEMEQSIKSFLKYAPLRVQYFNKK